MTLQWEIRKGAYDTWIHLELDNMNSYFYLIFFQMYEFPFPWYRSLINTILTNFLSWEKKEKEEKEKEEEEKEK